MKSETILETLGYKKYELDDRVSYFKSNNSSKETFSSDIITGLKQKQKIYIQNIFTMMQGLNYLNRFVN